MKSIIFLFIVSFASPALSENSNSIYSALQNPNHSNTNNIPLEDIKDLFKIVKLVEKQILIPPVIVNAYPSDNKLKIIPLVNSNDFYLIINLKHRQVHALKWQNVSELAILFKIMLSISNVYPQLNINTLIVDFFNYKNLDESLLDRFQLVAKSIGYFSINFSIETIKSSLKESRDSKDNGPLIDDPKSPPAYTPIGDEPVPPTEETLDLDIGAPGNLTPQKNKYHIVTILYGTNRKIERNKGMKYSQWYNSFRNHIINYGEAEVSIPATHKHGNLERPIIEIFENDRKHIVIQKLLTKSEIHFFNSLNTAIDSKQNKSGLIFLHGYNVSFASATRRAAQIHYDMSFAGVPILFSWPSDGELKSYVSDTNDARNSAKFIKEFLLKVIKFSNLNSIHIIAHSMGNLATSIALNDFAKEWQGRHQPIKNFVLAAPDVDLEEFKDRMSPHLTKIIQRTTLYTSQTDLALHGSKAVNDYPRLGGYPAANLVGMFPNMEIIDATSADMGIFNYFSLHHSYYGESKMLLDLKELLRGVPATHRRLKQIDSGIIESPYYWMLHQ